VPTTLTLSITIPPDPGSSAVAPPVLTAEQRSANLAKALAARTARAEMMTSLKKGTVPLAQVLTAAATDPVLANTKVLTLIQALPTVGKTRAVSAMTVLGIAATRRVKGLGPRQRAKLLERFPATR
jgi:hypothetical protein